MRKYLKLKYAQFALPIISLASLPLFTISCSFDNFSDDFEFDYKETQESLDELAKKMSSELPSKTFNTNYNKPWNKIQENDITWKHANKFPNIKVVITIIKREASKKIPGIEREFENAVTFKFKLIDNKNKLETLSHPITKEFWFHGYANADNT